jgi:hypothetical protein
MPEVLSWSDASGTGAGVVTSINDLNNFAVMNFTDWERETSSTFRELRAVEFGLSHFKDNFRNKIVKFYTDSQAAASILRNGSRRIHLHNISRRIFDICLELGVRLEIEWIPRDQNAIADHLSHFVDWDDWQVENWVFQILETNWGPHTVDRFANSENKKTLRFTSKVWYPGCVGVDAFANSWKNENNWIVPPVNLIGRSLQHLFLSRARGTFVVPFWRSAKFWPILQAFRVKHALYVKGQCMFSPDRPLIIPGTQPCSVFSDSFRSPLLALHCDFSLCSFA